MGLTCKMIDIRKLIFYYYQNLIRLRKEKDIIVYGGFEPLYRDDEQIFYYYQNEQENDSEYI